MPDGNRMEMGLQTRLAPVSSFNKELRTVEVVWTQGARVRRFDWLRDEEYFEELSLDPAHVRMGRLQAGAPLLNTHGRWRLEDVIGVVESASIGAGGGVAMVRFSDRESVAPIVRDVEDRILRNVSVGYKVHKVEKTRDEATGLVVLRAVDWEPMELSLVPIGADAGAGVRSEERQPTYPCEIIDRADPALTQELAMQNAQNQSGASGAAGQQQEQQQQQHPAAGAGDTQAAAQRAQEAERGRVREIRGLCATHKIDRAVEDGYINEGTSVADVRAAILAHLAAEGQRQPVRSSAHIVVEGDERVQRRSLMAEAIAHRLTPAAKLSDGARPYRYMSLIRLAEECLEREGVTGIRGMSNLELTARAFQSTSDFANILADVANKRLRDVYVEHVPTYTLWARRAPNAPDFKNINVVRLSDAPALAKVLEGGEFTIGKLLDGKEAYQVMTYGKIIAITRQAIINDDLNAFDRVPRLFAGSARALENYLVYQQLESNPTMADSVALFHADHGNLASPATDISVASLGVARAAMRNQTGPNGRKLNIAPAFLLVGTAKEQIAYQFTSANYVPATSSGINEFRAGGKTALEPIVDPEIASTTWYLAADANAGVVDTVEWCYLDGSEGVYLESQVGFDVDGIQVKARLDFATKVVEHRGLYKNAGA